MFPTSGHLEGWVCHEPEAASLSICGQYCMKECVFSQYKNTAANNDGGGQGKQTNPKDALGSTRVDLSLISPFAMIEESLAYEEGLCKYGRSNYRIAGIRAMIYIGAALRHIWKYIMGEQRDPKTGVHHLGSARACLGIILDAEGYGKLTDDRPPSPKEFSKRIDDAEASVKHLREVFKDHNPRHWTIADTENK